VVVNNLDIDRARIRPTETGTVLVVDSDRMLSDAVASKRLQLVSGRNAKLAQAYRRVQERQLVDGPLAERSRDNSACRRGGDAIVEFSRPAVGEFHISYYHDTIISSSDKSVVTMSEI
jgi:hypothetical protein